MSPYTAGLEDMARDILEVLDAPGSDQAHLSRIRTIVTENLPTPGFDPLEYYKTRMSAEDLRAMAWGER